MDGFLFVRWAGRRCVILALNNGQVVPSSKPWERDRTRKPLKVAESYSSMR